MIPWAKTPCPPLPSPPLPGPPPPPPHATPLKRKEKKRSLLLSLICLSRRIPLNSKYKNVHRLAFAVFCFISSSITPPLCYCWWLSLQLPGVLRRSRQSRICWRPTGSDYGKLTSPSTTSVPGCMLDPACPASTGIRTVRTLMAYDLLVQKSEARITANILPSTGQENNGAQHKTDICDLAFCLIFDFFHCLIVV